MYFIYCYLHFRVMMFYVPKTEPFRLHQTMENELGDETYLCYLYTHLNFIKLMGSNGVRFPDDLSTHYINIFIVFASLKNPRTNDLIFLF